MRLLFEGEVVSGRILDPWVVVGALDASMKTNRFSWKLPGGQWAGVWQGTDRLTLDLALLFPGSELIDRTDFGGLLNPLENLGHGDEIDVVLLEHLIDPLDECVEVLGVELQPGSVEVETEWGTVGLVVALEVVIQEVVELFTGNDVGAGVDHRTTGEFFIEGGIVSSVQLVHDHFPDGV